MPDGNRWHRPGRMALLVLLGLGFVALCVRPYVGWLAFPSLYHDDFMRVWSLRNTPIRQALFRPFNEHMAPLFETLSYLAWLASGRDLGSIAVGFMAASFAGLAASVGMVWALIRRESGSSTAALVGVALFCLSSASAETVLWYSACSFQWAAAGMLLAWFAAASAVGATSGGRQRAWLLVAAVASIAAPAFSAIGILAAPLAVLRILVAHDRAAPVGRTALRSAWPALGLVAYLGICATFRYERVLADSLHRNLDLGSGLWATARAPGFVLLPALAGLRSQAFAMPGWVALAATLGLFFGSLVLARDPRRRPLILGGLALIAGGYSLAYGARARRGDLWLFEITRYHLFPQIGLVCMIAGAAGPTLRRLDRRPARGLAAALSIALLLAWVQYPGMRDAAKGTFRFPEQPRLIAAARSLEAVAVRERIPLDQLFRTIEPIQPRWAPHPWAFHPILFLVAVPPTAPRLTDFAAREAIIAGLSGDEREMVFGSMDAGRHRLPIAEVELDHPAGTARLVATSRIAGDRAARVGSYFEYRVDPGADAARSLCLPRLEAAGPVEIWWAGEAEAWSPNRSVRWRTEPHAESTEWALPIEAFPHWRRGSVRKLRIVAREPGRLAVEAPRFLR